MPGDADEDGDVDLDDFMILKNNFGTAAAAPAADIGGSANLLAVGATETQSKPVPPYITARPTRLGSHTRVRPHRRWMRRRVGHTPLAWTGESFDALTASRLMMPLA
jgi:hypothetical protein